MVGKLAASSLTTTNLHAQLEKLEKLCVFENLINLLTIVSGLVLQISFLNARISASFLSCACRLVVVRELAASCHHNQPTLTTQKTREVMRDLLEFAKNYPLIKIRDITSTGSGLDMDLCLDSRSSPVKTL